MIKKLSYNKDDLMEDLLLNSQSKADGKSIPGTVNEIIDQLDKGASPVKSVATENGLNLSSSGRLSLSTASESMTGAMSKEDKTKLDTLHNYELPKATETILGGVTVDGTTITVQDGKISAPGEGGKIYTGIHGVEVDNNTNIIAARTDNTTIKVNDNGNLEVIGGSGKTYNDGIGISVDNVNNVINAKIDNDTIQINPEGKMYTTTGRTYNGQQGIYVDNVTSTIGARVDNNTIKVNSDGNLEAPGTGKVYQGINGINVNNDLNLISAKIDNDSIQLNEEGKMVATKLGKTYYSGPGIYIDNTANMITAMIDDETLEMKDGAAISVKFDENIKVKDVENQNGLYLDENGQVKLNVATPSSTGAMSKEDKSKLDDLHNYVLPKATAGSLGGVMVDGSTITIDENGKISAHGEGKTYTGDGGIYVDNEQNVIYASTDNTTIHVNQNGKLEVINSGGQTYYDGRAIHIGADNKINVMADGSTIGYTEDGRLKAINSGGKIYSGTQGIQVDNTNNTISALTDEFTIKVNEDGKLAAKAYSGKRGIDIDDNGIVTARIDDETIKINDETGRLYATGGGGSDYQAGIGLEIDKTSSPPTISAKIGTNNELGVIKADGVSVFLDPDGTLSSKATLADITAGNGIAIEYGSGNQLPEGYTELVFVRGKGNAYIDTGVNADDRTGFRVTAQKLAVPAAEANVFGAAKSTSIAGVQFLNSNHGARCCFGTYSTTYSPLLTGTVYDRIFFFGDMNKRVVENLDTKEEAVIENLYPTQWDMQKNYTIGRINGLTSGADFTGRIYEVMIWEDGSLVRHYVPAKKNDTQEVGFYDTVNSEFVKSATSAQFTEGPDAIPTTIINAPNFIGATESRNGSIGIVPAPRAADFNHFLKGDGTWAEVPFKTVLPRKIYIDNQKGVDEFELDRGMVEDKPFKTVQYALDVLSAYFKIGYNNASLIIKGYPNNTIESLHIPYIESNGGWLVFGPDPITIQADENLSSCVEINSKTKVSFLTTTFKIPANIPAEHCLLAMHSDIRLTTCSFINETEDLSSMIYSDNSTINMSNISFQNDGSGSVRNIFDITDSKIINDAGILKLTNVNDGILLFLSRSSFYYDGPEIAYPEGATFIPYRLICSDLYLTDIENTEFFYKPEHLGNRDKLSVIYNETGVIAD